MSGIADSNVVPHPATKQEKRDPFQPIIASAIEGDPEAIEYVVDGIIPKGTVTLYAGQPDLGKSYSCLMLQVAAAVGIKWFGRQTRRCRSLGLYTEDPGGQLHRRRDAICEHYEVEPLGLEDMVAYIDNSRLDPVIYRCRRFVPEGEPTPLWQQIRFYILQNGIELLVLDNASTVLMLYGAEEPQTRAFIRWLVGEARSLNIAIVLLHHPPKGGGSPYAGTAAWERQVRQMVSLERPPEYDPATQVAIDERVIMLRKSNYTPHDDPARRGGIPLRWAKGALVVREVPMGRWPMNRVERADLDLRVLLGVRSLIRNGCEIGADPQKRSSLPSRASRLPDWKAIPFRELVASVERLIGDGRLKVEKGLLLPV